MTFDIPAVVAQLHEQRTRWRHAQKRPSDPGGRELPSRDAVAEIVRALRGVLFPMRLGPSDLRQESEDYYVGHTLDVALNALLVQLRLELNHGARHVLRDASEAPAAHDIGTRALTLARDFAASLAPIRALLDTDVEAAFHGDPAARSVDEVLLCYPGIEAMIHHRLAHRLYALGAPLLARIVAEQAHALTGIDIHPGASIGPGFFIDHGTGVVIGETAVIGERVRVYQAVTLGAKRFPADADGRLHKGGARHPIVEDDVVIYAGATILGRVTIGAGSTIGGNVWLTRSVPPHSNIAQASSLDVAFDAAAQMRPEVPAGRRGAIMIACTPSAERFAMTRRLAFTSFALAALAALAGCAAPPATDRAVTDDALQAAVASPQRSDASRARDPARHPLETLRAFGVQPTDTIVEIAPGGGWYTEILAPWLRERGRYVAVLYVDAAATPAQTGAALAKARERFDARFTSQPGRYGAIRVGTLGADGLADAGAPGSADVVLTFRNIHNWIADGDFDAALRAFNAVLKPGGVLGVEEHRAAPGTPLAQIISSGYVPEAYVIAHARAAGFKLQSRSETNANPRDTKDHPNGVWSLPPTLRGGAADREKFLAIGESDRMTLRFVKPAQ